MRRARHKSPESTFYHLITRVVSHQSFFPFKDAVARQKLQDLIFAYVRAYSCRLAAFELMSTHYHLILWMECFRRLSRRELKHRAFLLWGEQARTKTAGWTAADWQWFNRKLFDLSALMQHVNGEYAKWYNRTYGRSGHFWGARFKSLELLDRTGLERCLVYVETNVTRAHVVKRPEQWRWSSAWQRFHGRGEELIPIEEIFTQVSAEGAYESYRERLEAKWREDERKEAAGWSTRERVFSDGIALGVEMAVRRLIERKRREGIYRRRRHPVAQFGGALYSVREQRSHARS